jgi:hypothetical protein
VATVPQAWATRLEVTWLEDPVRVAAMDRVLGTLLKSHTGSSTKSPMGLVQACTAVRVLGEHQSWYACITVMAVTGELLMCAELGEPLRTGPCAGARKRGSPWMRWFTFETPLATPRISGPRTPVSRTSPAWPGSSPVT